jgi:hypothetical protein
MRKTDAAEGGRGVGRLEEGGGGEVGGREGERRWIYGARGERRNGGPRAKFRDGDMHGKTRGCEARRGIIMSWTFCASPSLTLVKPFVFFLSFISFFFCYFYARRTKGSPTRKPLLASKLDYP